MSLTAAERRLKYLLSVLVFVFLLAAFLYELGPIAGPFRTYFKQLPFVSNSVVKVSLLMLLCLYAAGDVRKRIGLVAIFIAAHLISVAAMLVFLLLADTSYAVSVGPWTTSAGSMLWGAIALDGVITLVVALFYIGARRAVKAQELSSAGSPDGELTGAERWMRGVLIAFGIIFVITVAGYEMGPLLPAIRDFFIELPFVSNSVVKVGMLAMICFYAAQNLRRNMAMVNLLIVGHVVSMIAQIVFLLAADTGYTVRLGAQTLQIETVLWGAIALDGGIAVILFLFYQAAWNARFQSQFLRPTEYRTLIALSDVLVRGQEEKVPPVEIAANVDQYVSRIRARRRWVYRVVLFAIQLHPLLYFKAPFSELDEEARLRHLKKHFYREVIFRLIPDWWRKLVQAMIRVGKQLTYVGYYNDPRTFASVGYVPFLSATGTKNCLFQNPNPIPSRWIPLAISGHHRSKPMSALSAVVQAGRFSLTTSPKRDATCWWWSVASMSNPASSMKMKSR